MDGDAPWLRDHIREIHDYPEPGVVFRDITPLLGQPAAFGRTIDDLVARFHDVTVDRVVGIESRGFIVASPVAYRLRAGFVPVRKAGKLPWAVAREEYALEYGTDKLEIHRDAIHPDEHVLIVDDVLATGRHGCRHEPPRRDARRRGRRTGLLDRARRLGGRAKLGERRVESLVRF
jgi:adenine phosphoribosyltransferase